MTATICLLSPASIWVNPRLRKEADSLTMAGYNVVVGYRSDAGTELDDAILATKPWRWTRVDAARSRVPIRWARAAARQRAAEWLVRGGVRAAAVDAAAYCRSDDELLAWASSQGADLYIAHTQPVIPVAAAAARRRGVPFAFDCEDLLADEAADGGRAPWRRAMIRRIEARYLPSAAYVSATSAPMAAYLETTYGLEDVPYWHNCFPLAETSGLAGPDRRAPAAADLVWMSATIGPGRGLEDVFGALARLEQPPVLHLYGSAPSGYGRWLDEQRSQLSDPNTVQLHAMPAADQVMTTLSQHRIGLTLDPNDCLNRSLTICNKLFLYLQAGLACIATDTPGQRSVLGPDAPYGAMYNPGDADGLAAAILRLSAPAALAVAQRAAWEVGRTTFCWDVEQSRFLEAVGRSLTSRRIASDTAGVGSRRG